MGPCCRPTPTPCLTSLSRAAGQVGCWSSDVSIISLSRHEVLPALYSIEANSPARLAVLVLRSNLSSRRPANCLVLLAFSFSMMAHGDREQVLLVGLRIAYLRQRPVFSFLLFATLGSVYSGYGLMRAVMCGIDVSPVKDDGA